MFGVLMGFWKVRERQMKKGKKGREKVKWRETTCIGL